MTIAITAPSFGKVHFGEAPLGHKKRVDCLVKIADLIRRHPGDTLPHKLTAAKDYKAMDRLMNRPEVTHDSVLVTHRIRTIERMRQTPVALILHDTTELDYSGLHSISDLSSIGNGHGRGLLCHNSLAYDPDRHEVLGLANQILHRRRLVGKKESVHTKRERKDRESRLWLQGVGAIEAAPPECQWIHVADRGSDTFEYMGDALKNGKLFLSRSCMTRRIGKGHDEIVADQRKKEKVYLHEYVRSLPVQAEQEIVVRARPGQKERKTKMAVSFAPVRILPPHKKRGNWERRPLPIWVVRVSEINPPQGSEPLEWILLTNVPIESAEAAWRCVHWYECRWVIEEYHKAMKTGCAIEDLQFASSQALEPMIALLSVVATTLLSLREAARRDDAKERPARDFVDPIYIEVLSAWRHGKAKPNWSVHDFFNALGRLGGSQRNRRLGWLVLWRGWIDLQHMVAGAVAVGHKVAG
jgi:hypothetical protein